MPNTVDELDAQIRAAQTPAQQKQTIPYAEMLDTLKGRFLAGGPTPPSMAPPKVKAPSILPGKKSALGFTPDRPLNIKLRDAIIYGEPGSYGVPKRDQGVLPWLPFAGYVEADPGAGQPMGIDLNRLDPADRMTVEAEMAKGRPFRGE